MADAHNNKKAFDWERIEAQFRAGAMSVREIASEHGITEGAIRKRSKRDGWARDLAAKVNAKADQLVRTALVRSEVRTETPTEKQEVEVEAKVQARIRIAHRTDISRSRNLVMGLLEELEHQTNNRELMQRLGELMLNPDEKGIDKLNEAYNKAITLGSRTTTMKALADSLKGLVALEREAYGLAAAQDSVVDPLLDLLASMKRSTVPVVQKPGDDEE